MENAVIYLDPSFLKEAALFDTKQGEAARQFIFSYPSLVTSTSTVTEALMAITQTAGKEYAIKMCGHFVKLPNLSFIQSEARVALQTIENFKTTTLSARNSMHLAYMQTNNITKIASLDPAFDKVKGVKRVKP